MAGGSWEQGTLLSIPGRTEQRRLSLPSGTARGGDVQMPPALFAGVRFYSLLLFKQGALVEGQTRGRIVSFFLGHESYTSNNECIFKRATVGGFEMTQCCILKRTRESLVPQSYLYATCQGNSQTNEPARNILFKRQFLRIWSQKKTPSHNCMRVLVRRALLAGEKFITISSCAAYEGLFPLPEGVTTSKVLNPKHANNLLLQQHHLYYSCLVQLGCKKRRPQENAQALNRFVAHGCSFPWVNSKKQE